MRMSNIPVNFELQDLCALEDDEIHNLVCYIRCLRPILENMNCCNTSQEAYIEAFRVEHMLKMSHMLKSRMRQGKP